MGVDNDRRLAETAPDYDVCAFSPHAGYFHQLLDSPWYLAVIALQQDPGCIADILGLCPEEPRRVDYSLDLLLRCGSQRFGIGKALEKQRCYTVYLHVGSLCRKNDGDKELEARSGTEPRLRHGNFCRKRLINRMNTSIQEIAVLKETICFAGNPGRPLEPAGNTELKQYTLYFAFTSIY